MFFLTVLDKTNPIICLYVLIENRKQRFIDILGPENIKLGRLIYQQNKISLLNFVLMEHLVKATVLSTVLYSQQFLDLKQAFLLNPRVILSIHQQALLEIFKCILKLLETDVDQATMQQILLVQDPIRVMKRLISILLTRIYLKFATLYHI